MSPPWILRRLANVSPFLNSLSNRLRITNLIGKSSLCTHIPKTKSTSQIKVKKKWWQLNIWPTFKVQGHITRPKIIGPERNVNLICNLSLYTHIPNIKSISQSIAKKSGDNCFISEIQTWVTIKIIVRFDLKSNGSVSSTFMYNIYQYLIYIITLSRQS
jgi:hypothetical protein